MRLVSSPYDAAHGATAVVIATEWDEFKCESLDYRRVYENMVKPAYLFDGRAIVNKTFLQHIGFSVAIIGKGEETRLKLFQ
jgi:UDPglucose 6-dehydrogenase